MPVAALDVSTEPDCVMVGVAGTGLTVTLTVLLVAVAGVAHAASDVKIQLTTSPFCNVLLLNVDPVEAFELFTCHW